MALLTAANPKDLTALLITWEQHGEQVVDTVVDAAIAMLPGVEVELPDAINATLGISVGGALETAGM